MGEGPAAQMRSSVVATEAFVGRRRPDLAYASVVCRFRPGTFVMCTSQVNSIPADNDEEPRAELSFHVARPGR